MELSKKIKVGVASLALGLATVGTAYGEETDPTIAEDTMEEVTTTLGEMIDVSLDMFFSVVQYVLPFLIGIGVFYLAFRWIMGRIR